MDESRPHPEPTQPPQGNLGIPAEGASSTPPEHAATEVIPAVDLPVPESGAEFEALPGPDMEHEAVALQRPPARWPAITLIVAGALLILPGSLLMWFAAFIIGLNALGSATDEFSGGEFPNGGSIALLEDTTYSIDAFATGFVPDTVEPPAGQNEAASVLPQCTVQGPDGADVPVEPQSMDEGLSEILTFTTTSEGDYTATCEADYLVGEIQVSVYEFTPIGGGADVGGVAPVVAAVITAVIGLAALAVGIVWLVRVNRRRRALHEHAAAVAAEWQTMPDGAGDSEADGAAVPGGAGVPAASAAQVLPEPKPSDDPRVVFSPENAFGTGRGNGKPPSMVPAILAIVIGGVLMVGGPVGGALAPLFGFLANPGAMMEGGTVQNGDAIELPGGKIVAFIANETPESLPQTDADWENYRPAPTPECDITDPNGDPIELEVEDVGGGYESASFTSTDSGEYVFQCELGPSHDGSFMVFPMGDAENAGMPKSMVMGLASGGVGLVVLIAGIVLAVRTSARRHDAGL